MSKLTKSKMAFPPAEEKIDLKIQKSDKPVQVDEAAALAMINKGAPTTAVNGNVHTPTEAAAPAPAPAPAVIRGEFITTTFKMSKDIKTRLDEYQGKMYPPKFGRTRYTKSIEDIINETLDAALTTAGFPPKV